MFPVETTAPWTIASVATRVRRFLLAIAALTSVAATRTSADDVLKPVWTTDLGSTTYSQPLVFEGRVYVGSNNTRSYLPEYPSNHDLGVMLCFDAENGAFLWQQSHEKLATGRQHDWPTMGVTSSPIADRDANFGNHIFYVSNRAEVVCLKSEYPTQRAEPVWTYDMIGQLNVSPHNGSCSQPVIHEDLLFVVTGNGVGPSHTDSELNPEAPSFIALNKQTGNLVWSDSSPAGNVLHGQWSSPIVYQVDGTTQVVFPGGDGWLYAFDVDAIRSGDTNPLVWKFDANRKKTFWRLGGLGNRNNIIAKPVFDRGLLYIVLGQDPEHGDGAGGVLCIEPTGRGDVSEELVFNAENPAQPIAHKRLQACVEEDGDFVRPNPNSKLVWRAERFEDVDGKLEIYEQTISRSIAAPLIVGELIFVADFSGLVHCLDRQTGLRHWFHDAFAQIWNNPIAVDNNVYVATEDGDIYQYVASGHPNVAMPTPELESVKYLESSILANMTHADGRLYVATRKKLHAFTLNPKPTNAN